MSFLLIANSVEYAGVGGFQDPNVGVTIAGLRNADRKERSRNGVGSKDLDLLTLARPLQCDIARRQIGRYLDFPQGGNGCACPNKGEDIRI